MIFAAAALNHLLTQNAWAKDRLAAHAGKTFELRAPPLAATFTIGNDGLLTRAASGVVPLATLSARPDAWARFALMTPHDASLIAIEGDSALGVLLLEVLPALQWEAEEDLSHLVGDVLARRIAGTARELLRWPATAVQGFAETAVEYLTEEQPMIAKRVQLEQFARDVDTLRLEADRLEARAEMLLAKT